MRGLLATFVFLSCLTFVWTEEVHSAEAVMSVDGKPDASSSTASRASGGGTGAQPGKTKPETESNMCKGWPMCLLIIYVSAAIVGLFWPLVHRWLRKRREGKEQGAKPYELPNLARLGWEKEELKNSVIDCWDDLKKAVQQWYERKMLLWGVESYATTTAVVSSILLAAIASPAPSSGPAGAALIAVISVHLAITQSLHKGFKVEQRLIDLKTARHQFLGFHGEMRYWPDKFLKDGPAPFFERAAELKQKYNAMATESVPTEPGDGSRTASG